MALSAQAVALRCALRRLFAAAPTILAMKSCPPFSAGEGAVPRRPTWSLVKWSTSPHEDRRARRAAVAASSAPTVASSKPPRF